MLLCYNPCQTYFWFLLLLLQVKLSISSYYYDLRLLTFSPLRSWHHHGMENKITNKWVETAVVAVYICITCILQYCCHSNFKNYPISSLSRNYVISITCDTHSTHQMNFPLIYLSIWQMIFFSCWFHFFSCILSLRIQQKKEMRKSVELSIWKK